MPCVCCSDPSRACRHNPHHPRSLLVFMFFVARKERKDPTWCRRNFVNGRSVARAVDVRQQLAKILRERLRIDPEVRMEHVVSVWICVCVFVCHGDGAEILHLRCFSQGLASYVVRKPSDLLFTRLFEPWLFRGRHRVIMILGASLRRSALKCKRCAHDVKNVVRHHTFPPSRPLCRSLAGRRCPSTYGAWWPASSRTWPRGSRPRAAEGGAAATAP